MPCYKYQLKNGKTLWYANFYCTDWTGTKKHICKRGFSTQKEAKNYERNYILQAQGNIDMLFSEMAELYLQDAKLRLKQSAYESIENTILNRAALFFGDCPVSSITPVMVRQWQTEMINAGFKPSYINTSIKRLSTMFKFAMNYYGLSSNPCKIVKALKTTKSNELNIWTVDEFNTFIAKVDDYELKVVFDTLFYTGIRVGECLALTKADILSSRKIDINKNGFTSGKDFVIQDTPKTAKSMRQVDIPEFLYTELTEYINSIYGLKDTDRIFPTSHARLRLRMKRICADTGLKFIRVHDLRHSHVSLLISMGYDAKLISERLGHESISITLDVYGHLYQESGKTIADGLECLKSGKFGF